MLIEFTLKNYKSFKDEMTLTMVAGSDEEHQDTHVFSPSLLQETKNVPLLRTNAIFGPNASGKSNLIQALQTMRGIVKNSGKELGNLPIVPFLFSKDSLNLPTKFEVIAIVNKMQFQYGFSATNKIIAKEWLYTWPKGRKQSWFVRETNPQTKEVSCKFSEKLSGEKEIWRRSTRPNALLLSTAITLNSKHLIPIFEWFTKILHVSKIDGWGIGFTAKWCEDKRKSEIVEFLKSADFAIEDLNISEEDMRPEILPENMPSDLKRILLSNTKLLNLKTKHQTDFGQTIELDLSDESDGTQKLFELAGPWLDTLEKGHVIFYDELNDHLHPKLVEYLIKLFHNSSVNKNNAQLIFSTHDISVFDKNMLRRDQIWLCERNSKQESELYSLSDFPRPRHANLARSYLSGRFGALPYPRLPLEDMES